MTNPAAIQTSNLVRTLTLLYSMQDADTIELATRLEQQRGVEWTRAIQAELVRYGCTQSARPPAGNDAAELSRASLTDARSIANTYNRELQNQVQRLYAANPRGNRNYYFKALEAWSAKRQIFKGQQIALNTAATTRSLAQTRFRAMNAIEGKYLFGGPAPVCIQCTRLKALGLVTIDIVQRYPTPIHLNCPHEWVQARGLRGGIDCATAWAGA